MAPDKSELEELTRKAQKAVSLCPPGHAAYVLVPTETWLWLEEDGRLGDPEDREEMSVLDQALDDGYIIEE